MASLIKNIAHQYDSSKSYEYGDYVIYEQMLYMCISDTTAAFDAECWKEVYLTDIVSGKTDNIATEPKLLWQNPNPSSGFGAQTISLDLSEYTGVIVELYEATTDLNVINRTYIRKSEIDWFGGGTVREGHARGRNISVTESGVAFSNGFYDSGMNDATLPPARIYGVKNDSQIGNSSLGVKTIDILYDSKSGINTKTQVTINNLKDYKILIFMSAWNHTLLINNDYMVAKTLDELKKEDFSIICYPQYPTSPVVIHGTETTDNSITVSGNSTYCGLFVIGVK